jgi:hypothetical protein
MTLTTGAVFFVGRDASVQFAGDSAITVRVIRVDRRPTYAGWEWLDVYVLGFRGEAIDRRQIFVQTAGLRPVSMTEYTPLGGSGGTRRGRR